MNLTRSVMSAAVIFLASGPILAQQTKQQPIPLNRSQQSRATPDSFMPDEPKECVEFDEMAARVDAVTTTEEINADQFAAAAAQPKVIIRNPGKVFDLEMRNTPLGKAMGKLPIPSLRHTGTSNQSSCSGTTRKGSTSCS
jgi:hypothetical protein